MAAPTAAPVPWAEAAVRDRGPVPRFELAAWRAAHGVVAGITGRGSDAHPIDLRLTESDGPLEDAPPWSAFARQVAPFTALAVARQVHGATTLWHDRIVGLARFAHADGHATGTRGVLLAITVADCIPVYVVDPVTPAVALLHAGWRGVAAGVVEGGIGLLAGRTGTRVENLLVHCGVGICGACYEVGSEVARACGVEAVADGPTRLDLRAVIAGRVRRLGVDQVTASPHCSAHDSRLFWSHRASGGGAGRMVAYLGLLP
jgi:YfiH family protein